MDLKPESPASSIALMNRYDYKDKSRTEFYTIHCECGSQEHEASMWIETDAEEDMVSVTFYVVPHITLRNLWTRIQMSWLMLTKGTTYPQQAEILLKKQGVVNLIGLLEKSKNKI